MSMELPLTSINVIPPTPVSSLAAAAAAPANTTTVATAADGNACDESGDRMLQQVAGNKIEQMSEWLHNHADIFTHLSTGDCIRVVSAAQLLNLAPNEIVVRQGDSADSMYVVLSGKLSVYQHPIFGDNIRSSAPVIQPNKSTRKQLGKLQAVLDAGDVFGEMSLLSGVEWRLASVITDESCQLLVLSQQLFDRYIKQHVSEMYSEKTRFVLTNPYLKSAPSAFKTSLVILMRKKSLGYNELLIRQGQTINSVYFILRSAANTDVF